MYGNIAEGFERAVYLCANSKSSMMRFFALATLFLFFACTPDATTSNSEVRGTISSNGRLQEIPEASARANSNQAVVFRMGEASAKEGTTVCLPVATSEFQNLIGFQFTMRWDSTQLQFEKVQNFGLPSYGPTNFGDRFASRGYLSTLWTETALQGKTLPAGTTIFEVCFKNIAKKGTESLVRFTDGPTTFEVISADMSQWKLRFTNGIIKSE